MRGQKLFNSIIKRNSDEKLNKRGRNEELLDQRNSCMIARYYYYGKYKGKCFEEILLTMASEFFLTTTRISRIIQENTEVIKEMKDNEVSIYQLQANYPHFKW